MVITAIKSLKNSTSIGSDGFSNNFVKSIACYLATPLSKIVNLFLQQSYCPFDWKTACVIPTYKNKSEVTDITNYRPITLISCFSKIF